MSQKHDKIARIQSVFNNEQLSLPENRIAYVARDKVIKQVEESLFNPSPTTYICGFVGVGKSSAFRLALDNLRQAKRMPHFNELILTPSDFDDEVNLVNVFARRTADPGAITTIHQLAQELNQTRRLVILEDAQGFKRTVHQSIAALAKAATGLSLGQFRLVVVPAVPALQAEALVHSEIRPPVDIVEIPAWEREEVQAIFKDGASKCEMEITEAVIQTLTTFSCGLPAAAHLFGQVVFSAAAQNQSNAVHPDHLTQAFGRGGKAARDLAGRLMRGPYPRQFRQLGWADLSVIALAGVQPEFTASNAHTLFEGLLPSEAVDQVLTRVSRSSDVILAEEGNETAAPRRGFLIEEEGMYTTVQRIDAIMSLLELNARAALAGRDDSRSSRNSLDRLLALGITSDRSTFDPLLPRPRIPVQEIKRMALESRHASLLDQYQAIQDQIDAELSAAVKTQRQKEADNLEKEIKRIEAQLEDLGA